MREQTSFFRASHARYIACVVLLVFSSTPLIDSSFAENSEAGRIVRFHQEVEPLLREYCYTCHGDGEKKGKVAFDEWKSDAALLNRDLWFDVLKNLREGLMPPASKPRPSAVEQQRLEQWIKYVVFGIDPQNPEPGHVTLRRLNRVEYRNTIHDLLGVDFDEETLFPPDDTGYGFDTIGDVLTIPPMLLEKYLAAAGAIVAKAVSSNAKSGPGLIAAGLALQQHHENNDEHISSFKWHLFTNEMPQDPEARLGYARKLLRDFASRAFRRPVDEQTLERLVGLVEPVCHESPEAFQAGCSRALVAVLASPRFLFRLEEPDTGKPARSAVNLDEYSLASRLSYFLWSTMPDDELLKLAGEGELRNHLDAQVRRMLADSHSNNFIRNFTGQWLRTREVEGTWVNERAVLARDEGRERQVRHSSFPSQRFGGPSVVLDHDLREAMRLETEMVFSTIVHEDRPVTELIESDYTFVNEKLGRLYGFTNVSGAEMRRLSLPAGSPRGGVLTEGGVLLVTSNPDRTSPVKRGLFILQNFLGTPPPPQPPDIPPLEKAESEIADHEPTLREALQMHRQQPLCASCHERMDPLGLAFENFNAMGMWRERERNQRIDAAGKLVTGETFNGVQELKHLLVTQHRTEFYRCLTEKLLTYAVGRGMEYYDVETVDQIVNRLERQDGRFSALLTGVIESAPFQKMRLQTPNTVPDSTDESSEHTPAGRNTKKMAGT